MNFIQFLNETGESTVARLLNATTPTVRQWRLGNACPRPMFAYKLIQLTDGQLTWDSIYNEYCEKHFTDGLQKQKDILQRILKK